MNPRDAAVIVLRRSDGRVLGVTRGNNIRDINFPGGRREPEDQNYAQTAQRELFEETGLHVPFSCLKPIAHWKAGHGSVIAFQALDWSGKLRPSAEGYPVWVTPERLLLGTHRGMVRKLIRLSSR